MTDVIDFATSPLKETITTLLQDKTTGKNIVWATNSYEEYGTDFYAEKQMLLRQINRLTAMILAPRKDKALEQQQLRTRKHAEVFTPSWICCKMNNYCDEEWFGRKNVFNAETGTSWKTYYDRILFPSSRTWQEYVESQWLEITCGEAPFLVSRYDTSTGEEIPVSDRIGILDRKLRIIGENTDNEKDWFKWVIKAYQSTYGYEYQGDNLLIGRINLLFSFTEHLTDRWHRKATTRELKRIAEIIAWNLWQMDGKTDCTPYGVPEDEYQQLSFFDLQDSAQQAQHEVKCTICNWQTGKIISFASLKNEETQMKFDFVIGNPPYQDETIGENKTFAPPVYHNFLDNSFEVGNVVEMIHPARFLFNAGTTPKAWNKKMLSDPHLKVLHYEQDSSKIFSNTEIKGGIVITYHNNTIEYGVIGTFTPYSELNSIIKKVKQDRYFEEFSSITVTSYAYHFTEVLHEEHPEVAAKLSKGHAYDLKTNVFERIPHVFLDVEPKDGDEYIKILGRENNGRVYKFIKRKYVNSVVNLDRYKLFISAANGSGRIDETLSPPIKSYPGIGSTETFMSIGCFETENEMEASYKYVKTKFARVLLSVLKVTQHITPEKWAYVPLQDFSENSDIDWSQSIKDIDRQLYKKYCLSKEEIDFIETHVKEMS